MAEVGGRLYEQLARLTRALAAPKRLELLDTLAQGPRTVERLARQTSLSTANASRHLQVLRAARLVEAEKHGLFVTYRLADEQVASLLVALRRLGETQLAELSLARRQLAEAAIEAVRLLTRRGRRASRLEDGVSEWKAAGLRIVRGVGTR